MELATDGSNMGGVERVDYAHAQSMHKPRVIFHHKSTSDYLFNGKHLWSCDDTMHTLVSGTYELRRGV